MEGYKTHKGGTKAWKDNKGKGYCLVLHHCPSEPKTELKNSARWEAATSNADVVALLLIIRDVMHNKKERAQSTIGLMESNVTLYTTILKGNNTLDEYYRMFKAQIDTIEAHGGNPGYCSALAQEHLEVQLVSNWVRHSRETKTVVGDDQKS